MKGNIICDLIKFFTKPLKRKLNNQSLMLPQIVLPLFYLQSEVEVIYKKEKKSLKSLVFTTIFCFLYFKQNFPS